MIHWLAADALIWAGCGVAWLGAYKQRKLSKETERLNTQLRRLVHSHAPDLVEALREMALVTCPFCRIASGDPNAHMEDEDGNTISAEPQENGKHRIITAGREGKVPCLAPKAWATIRKIVEDMTPVEDNGKDSARR